MWVSRYTGHYQSGWHTYGLEGAPGYERFTFDGPTTKAVAGAMMPGRPMGPTPNSGGSSDKGRTPTADR